MSFFKKALSLFLLIFFFSFLISLMGYLISLIEECNHEDAIYPKEKVRHEEIRSELIKTQKGDLIRLKNGLIEVVLKNDIDKQKITVSFFGSRPVTHDYLVFLGICGIKEIIRSNNPKWEETAKEFILDLKPGF